MAYLKLLTSDRLTVLARKEWSLREEQAAAQQEWDEKIGMVVRDLMALYNDDPDTPKVGDVVQLNREWGWPSRAFGRVTDTDYQGKDDKGFVVTCDLLTAEGKADGVRRGFTAKLTDVKRLPSDFKPVSIQRLVTSVKYANLRAYLRGDAKGHFRVTQAPRYENVDTIVRSVSKSVGLKVERLDPSAAWERFGLTCAVWEVVA